MKKAHNNAASVVDDIIAGELQYAEIKHPVFPKGFGGLAIILEELGELAMECNNKWKPEEITPSDRVNLEMAQEAAQVAVTAIRFLRTAVDNGLDADSVIQEIGRKTEQLRLAQQKAKKQRHKQQQKQFYLKNRQKMRQYQKNYRKQNRTRLAKKAAQYSAKTKSSRKQYNRKRREQMHKYRAEIGMPVRAKRKATPIDWQQLAKQLVPAQRIDMANAARLLKRILRYKTNRAKTP